MTPRALERRAKRWLLEGPFDCFVQCAPGLEAVLVAELEAGGLAEPGAAVAEAGGVPVRLTAAQLMRANLTLRTAGRVLLRLGSFHASSYPMLFDHLSHLPWEVQIGLKESYALRVSSQGSRLQAGDSVKETARQAIERRLTGLGLGAKLVERSELEFHLRLLADRCTISLNTSGVHLHRRGFRRHIGKAPLRETTAAAVVLGAYRGHYLVLDPFCGSGSLLLEAADLLAGLPPGRARAFAFEHAAWFRPGMWREVKREAERRHGRAGADPTGSGRSEVRLIGLDLDERALAAARHNLLAAGHQTEGGAGRLAAGSAGHQAEGGASRLAAGGAGPAVELHQADSKVIDLDAYAAERGEGTTGGLLVSNLPYGVRLGSDGSAQHVIDRFLTRCGAAKSAWEFAFLTLHPELFEGRKGVSVAASVPIRSGGLRVHLVSGRLGAGS